MNVLHGEMRRAVLQEALGLRHEDHFPAAYLKPALEKGYLEMTDPERPRGSRQRYRLTEKGATLVRESATRYRKGGRVNRAASGREDDLRSIGSVGIVIVLFDLRSMRPRVYGRDRNGQVRERTCGSFRKVGRGGFTRRMSGYTGVTYWTKLVIESIFEADFQESSYGFRPMRNATQAMEATREAGNLDYNYVGRRSAVWLVNATTTAAS